MPREETEEERRARKERERQQRPPETEEERRIRKEKERERERQRPPETEEERRARKERERQQRPPETEEERRIRKEKERLEREQRPPETDEERRARKERERQQRPPETEEERRIRKEKERLEREQRPPETEEERRIRKEKERQQRPPETEEERRIRKEKERVEREEKARREVVHKPLPEARGAAPKSPMVGSGAATSDPKPEPVVQARPQARAAPAAQEAAAEGGGGGDGYDDDFEEEFTADEMAAAAAAIARENAAAKAALAKQQQQQQQQQQTAGGGSAAGGAAGSAAAGGMRGLVDESLPKGESRAGLDANSLERQKARVQFEKDVARATALRRLVDLDDVSGTIVDLAPMSQYDLYITNFGGAALAQVAVQAPPDRGVDIEIQAERVHAKSKGVQAPEDLGLFPERFARGVVKSQAAHADPNATASKSDEQQQQQQQRQKRPGVVSVDTTALSAFLFRVFPTIRTLLDENEATRNPLSIQRKRSMVQQGFSSSAVPLEYEAAHGRRVVDVSFSRLAPQYLLVVYGPAAGGSGAAPLAEFPGLALLWNTNDPSMPDKVLIAHGELTAGALSPTRGHLVFCGTRHGGVAVWDTREPDHYHGAASRGGYSPRLPSYTSDWVVAENHKAPIVRLSIAGYNSILGQRRDEAEQLVSLDEAGVVHFWMVTEGDGKSTIANPVISENDHGLHVFSSVRVFKASDLDAFKGAVAARGAAGGVATDLEFSPTDPSHLVIGTSTRALHVSRFGSITAPSSYGPEGAAGAALPVTSVHFSPTDSRVLLAGYDDGCVRVYLKDQSRPQVTSSLSVDPITRVRCSTHLKWTGFALDQRGIFYVLDFATARKTLPVVTAEISRAADGTCTTFDVSLADKAEVRIAVGFSKGLVEVHSLNDKIFAPPAQRQEGWA